MSGIGDKTIERIKEQLLQSEEDKNYVSKYDKVIKLDVNKIHQGDCLELMNGIPDKSIDMILCDLPYGTTKCSWDEIINFEKLWKQYKRVIKNNGAIALFGSEPFSTKLRSSNINMYKYDWIWDKGYGRQPSLANIQPMKRHEIISIFGKGRLIYNPIKTPIDNPFIGGGAKNNTTSKNMHNLGLKRVKKLYTEKFPDTVLGFKTVSNNANIHPTQKPVPLLEYLINTYTNEGELVLDNCIGSGSTAIASINTGRNYIGIELDEEYCSIAKNRVNEHIAEKSI